jgi:predicted TPR repeat methyltransferase
MTAFLSGHPGCYDAVIGAAALIHFGDLRPVFVAASRALHDGGLFVFTLFSSEAETVDFTAASQFDLARHGCYGHGAGYVERLAKDTRFTTQLLEKVVHEHDLNGQPVAGILAVLRRA